MKKFIIKAVCLFFAILTFSFPVYGAKKYDIETAINDILLLKKESNNSLSNGYLVNTKMMSDIFSETDSNFIIAMSQYGIRDNIDLYGKVMLEYLKDKYSKTQKISDLKSTSGAQIALTLLACDYNPLYIEDKNKNSYNFLADAIYKRDSAFSLGKDGTEAYAWGLIAMDAYNYNTEDDIWEIRDKLIQSIVQNQNEDGTFSAGNTSSNYLSALTLTAVGNYYNNNERKEAELLKRAEEWAEESKEFDENQKMAFEEYEKQYNTLHEPTLYDNLDSGIEKIIHNLSTFQDENGSYKNDEKDNVKVTSAVIIALCTMGVDITKDSRFIKNGNTLLDGLMKLRQPDGSFLSKKGGNSDSDTVYAFSALVAYSRFKNGQTPLYDFSKKTFEKKSDMLFISKKDEENLKNIGRNLDLGDYAYLYMMRNKLAGNNSPKANYLVSYIDYLMQRLSEQKNLIDYINSRGNEIVYSANGAELRKQRELDSLILLCDNIPKNNKDKIEIYDELKEMKKTIDTSITADTLILAVGVFFVLMFILVILLFYIKKKALKSITMESINTFHNHSLRRARNLKENDLKLPFEEDDDFFDYDFKEDDFEEDEENKALPFETGEDFFDYNYDMPQDTEDLENFNLPFENDDDFFTYHYEENENKDEKEK